MRTTQIKRLKGQNNIKQA